MERGLPQGCSNDERLPLQTCWFTLVRPEKLQSSVWPLQEPSLGAQGLYLASGSMLFAPRAASRSLSLSRTILGRLLERLLLTERACHDGAASVSLFCGGMEGHMVAFCPSKSRWVGCPLEAGPHLL